MVLPVDFVRAGIDSLAAALGFGALALTTFLGADFFARLLAATFFFSTLFFFAATFFFGAAFFFAAAFLPAAGLAARFTRAFVFGFAIYPSRFLLLAAGATAEVAPVLLLR